MDEQVERRLAEMPERWRKRYLRAIEGRSRKAAIDMMCLECVGWVVEEVRFCTDRGCPLWPYRPYK